MTLEMIATWVVVGAVVGVLGGSVMTRGGSGLMGDIPLGLMGSIVGSSILWGLGVAPEGGLVPTVGVAFVGAAGLLVAQRQFWPAAG